MAAYHQIWAHLPINPLQIQTRLQTLELPYFIRPIPLKSPPQSLSSSTFATSPLNPSKFPTASYSSQSDLSRIYFYSTKIWIPTPSKTGSPDLMRNSLMEVNTTIATTQTSKQLKKTARYMKLSNHKALHNKI